jgi:ankyrin repeat protein
MRSRGPWVSFLFVSTLLSCGAPEGDVHQAAAEGDLETVRALVGSDESLLSATDGESRTPLHMATGRARFYVAEYLLDQGANVDAADRGGETPLHNAVLSQNMGMVDLLLSREADLELQNSYGRTPLHLVARETGNAALASRLLEAGAEVNVVDRYGGTPLSLAAWRGFEDMVDLFLDNGADIPEGEAELEMGIVWGAQHGLSRLFGVLVEAGADLTLPNDGGGTLLHSASAGGSREVVEILVEEGLAIGSRDRYGWTPLHYAAREGQDDVVGVLLSEGAPVDPRTLAGYTPLHLATDADRGSTADLLEEAGSSTVPFAFPRLDGLYFGGDSPGPDPVIFLPDIVSTNRFEHGSITFSPEGDEAFWASSFIVDDSGYTRGRIMTSRLTADGWLPPAFADFSTDFLHGDDVPFFHPDGNRLFFLSARTDDPGGGHPGERIWYVDRTENGWAEPVLIQGGPNELAKHWQFSVSANGNIYFNSGAPGGLGAGDLYVSRFDGTGWLPPENLGAPVNTEYDEFSPFIAPDESYLIISVHGAPGDAGFMDLYVSFRDDGGSWSEPVNLGPTVNTPSHELCPFVSGDGRYLFFNSHRGGQSDIFWVDAAIIERLRAG